MKSRELTPSTNTLKSTVRLLFGHQGEIGRLEFFLVELARGAGLAACYVLYLQGWFVIAATFVPIAIWPGVVATIKRFRDLGHDPILILPVLVYLSAGFAVGYRCETPIISVIALGIYLAYIGGVKGRSDEFTSEDYVLNI